MRSCAILTVSLYLFVIAQFLPALWPDMGAWNRPDKPATPGWLVTVVAWQFYVPNAVLLLGPLLVTIFARLRSARLALGLLAVFYLSTPLVALAFWDKVLDVAVGFYFWVGSYLVSAIGAVLALPPKKPAKP